MIAGETQRRTNLYGCFDRRYLVEQIPTLLALGLAAALAWLGPHTPVARLWMVGLASLSVAYGTVITVAALRRLDELQQRIHLIAIAASFAVGGVLLSFTRFMELAGVPAFPTGMGLWMVMFAVWWVVAIVLPRRYR